MELPHGERRSGLLLPSRQDFPYLRQFVQAFYRREVVEVETENLIANLRKHGVIELEE